MIKRWWSSLNIAFSMYSRLPAAQCDWSEENMRYVMCFFPWIGIVIGALCVGWAALADILAVGAPLRNVILMLIPVAVSGGIHLDGLLDTADAMSSWRPREKRLEILKDSNSGAFAVIACGVYFFLAYAVADAVHGKQILVYALVFVISRSLSGLSVVTFPKASANGTVAGFAKNAQTRVIQSVLICYIIGVFAVLLFLEPVFAVVAAAAATLVFIWYYRMAMKYFGGINGDLAGCFLSVCEVAVPLAVVLADLVIRAI
ncbi:MAG: adenosylcobinamide-GDP ribazoletransferase [Lachnospiraceae bacterium]